MSIDNQQGVKRFFVAEGNWEIISCKILFQLFSYKNTLFCGYASASRNQINNFNNSFAVEILKNA